MYVMGNDNGPRDYNDFPIGVIPNEIEITNMTSCTDDRYLTIAGGDGIKGIGINDNIKITNGDTFNTPKIVTNDIKTCINETADGESKILLNDESNNLVKNSNLSYNAVTETLNTPNINTENITTTNIIAECLSTTSMNFENVNASSASLDTANVNNLNLAWKKACYYVEDVPYESDIYEMQMGPITSICIPAGLTICGTDCNFLAISKYFFPLVDCTGLERNRPILSNGFLCTTQQIDGFDKINSVKSGLEHGQYLIFQEDGNNRIILGAGTTNVYFRKDFIFSGIFNE